jgi:hypothetical protein
MYDEIHLTMNWEMVAEEIGKDNLLCIMEMIGGKKVYIPRPDKILAHTRRKCIEEGHTRFSASLYEGLARAATPDSVPDGIWRDVAEKIGTYNLIRFLTICSRTYKATYIPKPEEMEKEVSLWTE